MSKHSDGTWQDDSYEGHFDPYTGNPIERVEGVHFGTRKPRHRHDYGDGDVCNGCDKLADESRKR